MNKQNFNPLYVSGARFRSFSLFVLSLMAIFTLVMSCCFNVYALKQPANNVFNRDELLNELKGIDTEIYSRSIDILLSRLRNKLNDNAQNPKYIKTIRNMGYCFIGKRI